jgi:hypothetical protein
MSRMIYQLTFLLLTLMVATGFSQNQYQGFENDPGDTWSYTVNPAAYNADGGQDVWDDTTVVPELAPAVGTSFWYMRDLENPNGGTEDFHTMDFDVIDVSGFVVNILSFQYYTEGYDASDSIGYILYFDNGSTWDLADYVALDGNTQGWETVTLTLPADINFVRLRLLAKQNGGSDWAGFDDVSLESSATDNIPPLVEAVNVTSSTTIEVVFNEAMDVASATDDANYTGVPGLVSGLLGANLDTVTLTYTTEIMAGQPYTLTIENVQDTSGNVLAAPFSFDFIFNDLNEGLVITEIMYNNPGSDTLEFVEIYNNSGSTVALGGLTMSGAFDFDFPVMDLAAEETVLLAENEAAVEAFFGLDFMDWGSESLVNSSATLVLLNSLGDVVDFVEYDDDLPWPTAADGDGPSLELVSYNFDNNLGENWRANLTQVGNTDVFANPGVALNITTPVVSFAEAATVVPESAGTVEIMLTVTNSGDQPASVAVADIAGTAVSGTDYVLSTPTINIPANTTMDIPVEVSVFAEMIEEGGLYVVLELSNPVDAELGSIIRHSLMITDDELVAPEAAANPATQLNHLGSLELGAGGGSAEIVDYDPVSQRLFVTNSEENRLEIVDFSDPANPIALAPVNLAPFGGGPNHLVVVDGHAAVAIEAFNPQDTGVIVFFTPNGSFVNSVEVGPLPDMVTVTPDGTRLLVANEGEPNDDYDDDPEGSISVIDLSAGIENLTNSDVTHIGFTAFNPDIDALRDAGVRIFGPNATVAQDLEPEFITVSDDSQVAYVTLQENNAVAVINLATLTADAILPLGTKDYSVNVFDASNDAPDVFFANWPVKGFFMPDAIEYFSIGGTGYLITANEGDARDYDEFSEEERLRDASYPLDPTVFPDAEYLKQDELLGRMLVTTVNGDTDNDGDYDEIYGYGSRSFSIWNATTGELLYDSGSDFELITEADPTFGVLFNASNSNNTFKNRSDDKGPEPEGVVVGEFNGRQYAFIGLERIGGVMVYDVTDPLSPVFLQYINTRTVDGDDEGGDLGTEGMLYLDADVSPDGKSYLITANEVSSTLAFFELLPPPTISFAEEVIAVEETDGTITIELEVEAGSGLDGLADISVVSASTALEGIDFNLISNQVAFEADSTTTQTFALEILDDADEAGGVYLILSLEGSTAALPGSTSEMVILIKDNDTPAPMPMPDGPVFLEYLTSFIPDTLGGTTEIVVHDPLTQRLFSTNSEKNTLEIVDITDPEAPFLVNTIDLAPYGGGVNSVATDNAILAVAMEADPKTDPGSVVFLDTDGQLITQVEVGVLPDMLVFTPDGQRVLTANEGEPNDDYTIDPEGSISIIDISGGVATVTNANVNTLDFTAFNPQIDDLKAAGVRIFGPGATVAQDLEPEFITINDEGTVAYVVMQENNSVALVDLDNEAITAILPLGTKDWNMTTFDASNDAPDIFFANWNVQGFYHPDAIQYFSVGGSGYLITANEGDARDYDGYSEEARVKDDEYPLDPTAFPNAEYLKNDNLLGRMKVTLADGDIDNDGDYDVIHGYGARSFSIWDAATGGLVYDSGDDFERIIAADPVFSEIFNTDDEEDELKDRSDDKGPEPESVVVANVDGGTYGFVGLERIGGIMVYDLNDPTSPVFLQYLNTREVGGDEAGGDLSPEGLIHIPVQDSPNGRHLIVASHEVSGSLAIYQLNANCAVDLGDDVAVCDGDTTLLSGPDGFETYTWSTGSMEQIIEAFEAGDYSLEAVTEAGCVATDTLALEVLPLPQIDLGVDTIICQDDLPYTLNAGPWEGYLWSTGSIDPSIQVNESGVYSVEVTNIEGCVGFDEIEITVDPCLNTNELTEVTRLSIAPNPTDGQLNIDWETDRNGWYQLQILDLQGRSWEQRQVRVTGGQAQVQLDLSALPAGNYYLRLSNERGTLARMVSKQ